MNTSGQKSIQLPIKFSETFPRGLIKCSGSDYNTVMFVSHLTCRAVHLGRMVVPSLGAIKSTEISRPGRQFVYLEICP